LPSESAARRRGPGTTREDGAEGARSTPAAVVVRECRFLRDAGLLHAQLATAAELAPVSILMRAACARACAST
jgi:hypothetical protein